MQEAEKIILKKYVKQEKLQKISLAQIAEYFASGISRTTSLKTSKTKYYVV